MTADCCQSILPERGLLIDYWDASRMDIVLVIVSYCCNHSWQPIHDTPHSLISPIHHHPITHQLMKPNFPLPPRRIADTCTFFLPRLLSCSFTSLSVSQSVKLLSTSSHSRQFYPPSPFPTSNPLIPTLHMGHYSCHS